MNQNFHPVEDYLAQRDGMKLVDAVVAVDMQAATARSVTTDRWPLFERGGILPIVVVELIAQTAGISIRWEEMQAPGGREKEGGGLIVGLKEAVFHVPLIPLDATIITHAEKENTYMNYAEYRGYSQIGETTLGAAVIQVLRTD